jgi:crotonobetainyl-CoA:carnitine CoA-transferase CaiB-like acyl-CoA transferase
MSSAGYDYQFPSCPGFEMDNRGKRSIALDLDIPAAREVLAALAARADIVVTNLLPERAEKYGVSLDDVHRLNPSAIYALVTGYGSVGPDRNRTGWDHTSFWARSGIMGLMGEAGVPPSSCRGGMGDHTTGLNLLAAILVALRVRDQTGEGQFVDVALQQTGMWTLGLDIQTATLARQEPRKRTRSLAGNPAANTYLCRDGRWILLLMPTADYWPRFCRVIGREDWLADDRFATVEGRAANAAELIPAVEAVFAQRDYAEWMAVLDAAGLIYAPIPRVTEVIDDPQPRAMGAFTTIDHPQWGPFETLDTPFHVRGADIGARGPAPAVGEHTFAVLEDLGLDADTISDYAARGAFG